MKKGSAKPMGDAIIEPTVAIPAIKAINIRVEAHVVPMQNIQLHISDSVYAQMCVLNPNSKQGHLSSGRVFRIYYI